MKWEEEDDYNQRWQEDENVSWGQIHRIEQLLPVWRLHSWSQSTAQKHHRQAATQKSWLHTNVLEVFVCTIL